MTSRRTVLGLLAGAAAGIVGVPLLSGLRGSSSTGVLLNSRRALPAPFTQAWQAPPVLAPSRSTVDTDYFELVQRPAMVELLPGVPTPIWGYDGRFPGPTIVATRGRRAVVTHRNELPVPTVVHLHGGRTAAEHDGFPTDLLYPVGFRGPMTGHDMGGTVTHGARDYVYSTEQAGATLWYHDHRMDFTGPAVWRGLAGFHLVHDRAEDALGLPSGERDLPIMITDRAFNSDGSLSYPSRDPSLLGVPGVEEPYTGGVLGDVILVNGVPWPHARIPAGRHRLRLLNASNARRYRLRLDPGLALVQIGADAGLLHRPVVHDALEIAPGERFDVVVDFGVVPAGQHIVLRNEFGDSGTDQVMRFEVLEAGPDPSRVPDVLGPDPDPAPAAVTRSFVFGNQRRSGMSGWTINGASFDPDVAVATATLGTTERWQLTSDLHHPVHLHLGSFTVIGRGINGPGPYDLGPKDTIDLRPAEQAEILVRFDGFEGRYVLHCHNLEHEDMAMMVRFDTTR